MFTNLNLSVINELDGLAKGTIEGKYSSQHHGEMVREGAEAAVTFLETSFGKRHPNLRALTSKGSVMDTISFRSEETLQEVKYTTSILHPRFLYGLCFTRYCDGLL